MAISRINYSNYANFKGTEGAKEEKANTKQETPKENSLERTASKPQELIIRQTGGAAAGIASTVCPGLGQLFDGRPLAALGYFAGVVGAGLGSFFLGPMGYNGEAYPKAKIIGSIGLAITAGALHIANMIDASRGKKATVNVYLNKDA